MANQISGITQDYITYGRQLASNGTYDEAINFYALALEKSPELSDQLEPEFRIVLVKCNERLAEGNRIESIIANFTRAIKLFPNSIYFLNESGRHLFSYGFYEEALKLFSQALTKDSGSVYAEKNLNSLKNLLVERWHFRMLNDKIRNESYRAAINEMVKLKESRVFDLGTGTGLLAMYATEGKPMTVTACDSSSLMTNLTHDILSENRLLMSVIVINKMSTSINCSDICKKCSLLITELFDAGLFGEHILQSLEHAWENLLLDNADIIPQKAEFFIMGVDSEHLNSKYQLQPAAKSFLKMDPNINVHVTTQNETYDCDDIHLYKDLKYMTEAHSAVKIDFTDLNDIKDKLHNTKPYKVECKALKSGQINAFVGWFNLHLTENISITTDPRHKDRANAWQQAVFYDNVPRHVQENEKFTLEFFIDSEKLTMKSDSSKIIRISPDALRFLNDTDYMKKIKNCVGMTCIYMGQIMDISELRVIDFNPFPYFGFLMAQRGVKSLICCAKTNEDKEFIETIFNANDIDMDTVTILLGDVGSQDPTTFGRKKFHVIFVHVFDLSGDIDLKVTELVRTLKKDHLASCGLFIPADVTLMGQIVISDWLDVTNRVYDKNLNYTVSKYINAYQVSQIFHLDFNNLAYTPLTDPIEVADCLDMTPTVLNLPVLREGDANIVLCWYNIELITCSEEIPTKRPFSCIDGTAFMADPPIPMDRGDEANILCCLDTDTMLFKLLIDKENT